MSIHRFSPLSDTHRSAAEWRARLKAARNEREVIAVVRAFLASLTHYEWALLGLSPEAANVESPTELATFSYEVVRLPHAREPNAEMVISAMAAVLSDAVARLAHLGNPRNAETA